MDFFSELHVTHTIILIVALAVAFGFECVNGFHDTANAVATVIYTHSLKPGTAVVWSGLCNFIGVYVGGIGVAFSIVHLLPVDLLVKIDTGAGLCMVLSLLGAAIVWNFGTWYVGLPASSSHALIGAILGTGLMNSYLAGSAPGSGVNWFKAGEVGLSLLISPILGFSLAALLLLIAKRTLHAPHLYEPPGGQPPPGWIRWVLIGTCTGVSFAHGSNDGQKGMGLIMLILIGLIPTHFALDMKYDSERIERTLDAARQFDALFAADGWPAAPPRVDRDNPTDPSPRALLAEIILVLENKQSFSEISPELRWDLRVAFVEFQALLARLERSTEERLTEDKKRILQSLRADLSAPVEYVPPWVVLGVALALGLGTMVGWKRIVVTVGEKIGKTHLTYGQGACAEVVAMCMIGLADFEGLPVSTTHVLSSGVAGTMWANRSGIQLETVRNIILAWVLTLPVSMALAAVFFAVSLKLFG